MPWSCHAAECRGKRRRHRSPKWKTVSKQARQTCGRRTNANGATVTDRKMPLWGNISTENWSGIVKRTDRERKSDCLSDSPSSSHLPHLESNLAPFQMCVNYSLAPPSPLHHATCFVVGKGGGSGEKGGFVKLLEQRPPRAFQAIVLLSSPSD